MTILEALISQLEQRFQYEKRAQVCLWFDEKREFSRLIPSFEAHLAKMKRPPFVLLAYDERNAHGQIWLKRSIQTTSESATAEERKRVRFVLYLPLSEDCLDGRGEGAPLDLLNEYRVAGLIWRIGGKRPTLFAFLRQAEVVLPESPSEQRRLYEGGDDSLLAKYVAKFADRPAVFWTITLTPELAQSRLVGDIDQTILDLAVAPETTWETLKKNGLDREFQELVRERYGFEGPANVPAEWIQEFVAVLALTETYLGYAEPPDFPLAGRLPPLQLRTHHTQLVQRWLRDSENRTAWDRWIREVETKLDLSAWAKQRSGLSFSFPHLVRLRWQETLAVFEAAAPKSSATAEFFAKYRDLITREAEFSKASFNPAGAWSLLRDLQLFLEACQDGQARSEKAESVAALSRIYVDYAASVERRHIEIRQQAEELNLTAVTRVADREYASYTNTLNSLFFERFRRSGSAEVPGIPAVTKHLEQAVWYAKARRAVIIVDALRYDCALAIADLLTSFDVHVEPMSAVMPTITAIGMTALMPISKASVSVEVKGNNIVPKVNGSDGSIRANRLAFLEEFGADCREMGDLETLSEPPSDAGDLLVVFGHEEVDHIGHGNAQTLIRHLQLEIQRLARIVRKLHHWGYSEAHVVTDHGFILLDEDKLPEEVSCDKDWCIVRKERFALVSSKVDLPVATFPFAWDDRFRVAVPPGLAFFMAEKSFSHGGAALQELIIPHLVSRSGFAQARRVAIEVVLPTFELMRSAVKVTLRPRPTAETAQIGLFGQAGRTLVLDVLRSDPSGERKSVLAAGPKEVRIAVEDSEQNVTLFFHSAASFKKGALLDLDIRDAETLEQFPPGGIKLTVGRDM